MNIKVIMKKLKMKNWSVYRLAKEMDLKVNRIGNVVNGKTKDPQISTVVKIAKALDLTNDEFAELCGYRKDEEDG